MWYPGNVGDIFEITNGYDISDFLDCISLQTRVHYLRTFFRDFRRPVNIAWKKRYSNPEVLRTIHAIFFNLNLGETKVSTSCGYLNLSKLYLEFEDISQISYSDKEFFVLVSDKSVNFGGFKVDICPDSPEPDFVFSLCTLLNVLRKMHKRLKRFKPGVITIACGSGCAIHSLVICLYFWATGYGSILRYVN